MRKLEIKSEEILRAITDYTCTHHFPPSIRELCDILSIKSSQTVHKKLDAMRARGLVDWEDRKPRTLKVME